MAEIAPGDLNGWAFGCNGSDVVEGAIRMA